MTPLYYLTISSICLSVFYITYLLVFRNSTHFKQMRFFLIFSMLIACVLPFNKFQIGIDYLAKNSIPQSTVFFEKADIQYNKTEVQEGFGKPVNVIQSDISYPRQTIETASISWNTVLIYVYVGIVILLFIRIILQILLSVKLFLNSKKTIEGSCKIVDLKKQNIHFTLFRWIFINKEICTSDSYNQILEHEKTHAQQYHSFDVLLIELLSAVMWFNPFVWMLRKSLKLVHEFLADEGVLRTGVNKLQYQKLLVNQVIESSLIGFSSNFNSSTIKKRMQIMNSSKKKKSGYRIWLTLPIIAILFVSISVINAISLPADTNPIANKPFVVVVDAGHGGEQSGVSSNGILEKDISLAISKLLESHQNASIKIILTRDVDKNVKLEDRMNLAQKVHADLFVSLHVFGNKGGVNNRFTCFIDPKDSAVGNILEQKLKEIDQFDKSGLVLDKKFYLLNNAVCPSVIINLGCLTHNHKPSYLKSIEGQQLISQKLFDGIVEISKSKTSAVVIDPALSDSTIIDIRLSCKYKNKKKNKTEDASICWQNGCTFDKGMKRALSNKAYLYTAIYADVKSENDILMSSPDFIPSNADSEKLTKLLNSKFKTATGLVSDTVVWAKFYTPKDKKMPVVLRIGYNQKRVPKNLATPLMLKIFKTLDEYYKSSK